ncbi:MAG: hypothetical protein JNL17_10835 [Cyclobacteriaceae bacterium]|nr:hypothetical protein [Cyclobacteriaceae bacterium]
MARLNQKRGLSTKEFILENERLVVYQRSILNQFLEADIPFEDIHINRIIRRSKVDIFFILMSILIGFFFLAALISKITIPETKADWEIITGLGIGTLISLSLFFLTKKDEIILPTDMYSVVLYQKRPSRQDVDYFVNTLKDRVTTYVRNKYLILNRDLDNETRARHLFWMFERGFVSQQEFEEVKASIKVEL